MLERVRIQKLYKSKKVMRKRLHLHKGKTKMKTCVCNGKIEFRVLCFKAASGCLYDQKLMNKLNIYHMYYLSVSLCVCVLSNESLAELKVSAKLNVSFLATNCFKLLLKVYKCPHKSCTSQTKVARGT